MDYTETVYYTCLNNHCPKHRNVFMEGDGQHADCARERLWLEGQRPGRSRWLLAAVSVAGALAVIAGAMYWMRMSKSRTDVTALCDETERSSNEVTAERQYSESSTM
ncbi:MAG TPA: hypothetical protein VGZ02_10325 [Candidatus Baltobacteraceae bacterium]|jgi:hypothetical protein|nr:hypothetical protein [Candidatus Baltobacteraceae bacterium]